MMQPALSKELGLLVSALLLSAAEFWFFTAAAGAAITSLWLTLFLLALSIGWAVALAVALGLTKTAGIRAVLIIGVAITVPLFARSWTSVSGGVLLAIFLWLAQLSFAREISNRISYRPAQIFGPGVRLLLFGLITALVSIALTLVLTKLAREPLIVTEQQINPLLRPATPLIQNLLPGYSPEATIDDILVARIEQELAQLPAGLQVDPEQQLALSREQVERQLGQELSGQERLGTLVARFVNNLVENLAIRNPFITSLLVIIFMFLALRAFAPFLVWPILGGIAVVIASLRQLQIVRLVKLSAEVDRLEL